jgi:Cu+-exporting ATPase
MQMITIHISGLHCTSCSLTIDGALEDTPGVVSATTHYVQSITTIVFDPEKVSLQTVKNIITELGYTIIES